MSWQTVPGMVIIVCAVAGIGFLPYGVHRLFVGERKVGLDNWDFLMDKRDQRLIQDRERKRKAELEQDKAAS
jgi:hypothetical protein